MKKVLHKYYKDILIFCIPVLICSFFLFIYYPGIYNYDVFNQLSQIKNNSYTTAHPFIATFYLFIITKLLPFKSSVMVFQIFCFSFLWMLICKENRNSDSIKSFIIQIIITCFMAVNPLMFTSIISANKDTLFMLIFMAICLLLEKIIKKDFKADNKLYILLAFFLIFFRNVRHNGLYVNIIFIPLFLLVLFFKIWKFDKKKVLIFLGSLVAFTLIFKIPQNIFNVRKLSESFTGPGSQKALQLEGYLLNNNYLYQSEIDTLNKYVSIKSLSENSWNYTFMDPMNSVEKKEYYNKHVKEFFKDSIKIALNHKRHSLDFYHISSTIVWDIIPADGSICNLLWLWNDVPNKIDGYDFVNKDQKAYQFIDQKLTNSMHKKWVVALFYSPAFYMYLSIILTIYLVIKKNKYLWILLLYNLLNVAIISMSIPVQDTRYLLNNFALGYILMCICFNFKKKEE